MKRQLILLLTLCHSTLLIYSQNTTNSAWANFQPEKADSTPDWVERESPCKAITS